MRIGSPQFSAIVVKRADIDASKFTWTTEPLTLEMANKALPLYQQNPKRYGLMTLDSLLSGSYVLAHYETRAPLSPAGIATQANGMEDLLATYEKGRLLPSAVYITDNLA